MRLAPLLTLSFIAAAALQPADAAKRSRPSFDCRKAASEIEKYICVVPEYGAADREIATLFAKALKALPPDETAKLKADQSRWLKERDDCMDFVHGDPPIYGEVGACLDKAFRARITLLKKVVAEGKLPPEEKS